MIESSSRKWQDYTGYRLTQVSPTSMSGSFSSYSNHPDLAAFLPPGISTPARISKHKHFGLSYNNGPYQTDVGQLCSYIFWYI